MAISAECLLETGTGESGNQSATFSTFFRQTPTDPTAEEDYGAVSMEDMSYAGESEYSEGLAGEPSAAHWADMQAY